MCASGLAVDREHRVTARWITTLRRFTCGDGSDSITARKWLLGMDEASGYEEGFWKIVEGSGRYETLRGIGNYVSVHCGTGDLEGATFETWDGVADFDDSPPLLAVSSLRVSKPLEPTGTPGWRAARRLPVSCSPTSRRLRSAKVRSLRGTQRDAA
jgi:hypothetical protein